MVIKPTGIRNILIVDDEASLRHTMTRILKTAGCEVTTAGSGDEALTLLEDSSPNLVFLDVHLPGLNGIQVLKEIRQRFPKLPVVLLTGFGSLNTALEALRLGATDYLLKPVKPEVLVTRANTILTDQETERRKNEIREQIAALQAELDRLEANPEQLPTEAQSPPSAERFLTRGPLAIDLYASRASFGGRSLDLPPTTFDYLLCLSRHSPGVVPYQTLVSETQGYETEPLEAKELAKYHVHLLRQAIEPEPGTPAHILNVRGVGYRLIVD